MAIEKYCLIGYPLGHSMSPWIHEKLFSLSGKQAEYTLNEFPPEQLEQHVPELEQLNGFNITIPYKTKIIPLLDGLDETAERYQSVNCVSGKIGYNTDCIGFLRSVPEISGKVLLIGGGGVGRMIATEVLRHHAELTISEPNAETALILENELKEKFPQEKFCFRSADSIPVQEEFHLLINACPVGMFPKVNACPVSDALIQQCDAVFDVIYNPTETLLLQKAKSFGKIAVGSAAMLVWQAVRAHEIWYHAEFSTEQIQKIIQDMQEEINRQFTGKQ